MRKALTLLPLLLLPALLSAQASRHQLREGNRQYQKEHFDQAEVAYRRALERDSNDTRGQYNLGSALYRQQKYDDAVRHYEQSITTPGISDRQRAHALHNRGNSLLKAGLQNGQQELLKQALESYQEALKLDPKNDDTRYNLALARRLLQQAQQQKQQQGGGQDNDKQNQDKQQQNQNGDNQQQDQHNQQNQQGQQQNQDQQQWEQRQQRNPQQETSKRDAERMLEAVKNNERQTLREVRRNNETAKSGKKEKDW